MKDSKELELSHYQITTLNISPHPTSSDLNAQLAALAIFHLLPLVPMTDVNCSNVALVNSSSASFSTTEKSSAKN